MNIIVRSVLLDVNQDYNFSITMNSNKNRFSDKTKETKEYNSSRTHR